MGGQRRGGSSRRCLHSNGARERKAQDYVMSLQVKPRVSAERKKGSTRQQRSSHQPTGWGCRPEARPPATEKAMAGVKGHPDREAGGRKGNGCAAADAPQDTPAANTEGPRGLWKANPHLQG